MHSYIESHTFGLHCRAGKIGCKPGFREPGKMLLVGYSSTNLVTVDDRDTIQKKSWLEIIQGDQKDQKHTG